MTITEVDVRPDRYDDDPNYDYSEYWNGRDYAAEELTNRRLLAGRRFGLSRRCRWWLRPAQHAPC